MLTRIQDTFFFPLTLGSGQKVAAFRRKCAHTNPYPHDEEAIDVSVSGNRLSRRNTNGPFDQCDSDLLYVDEGHSLVIESVSRWCYGYSRKGRFAPEREHVSDGQSMGK